MAVGAEKDFVAIASLDDPRVAEYRDLRDADLRHRADVDGRGGLFIAEGRLLVRQLIEDSHFCTRSALVTPTAASAEGLGPALGRLAARAPVYVAEQALLNQVVGFPLHRGCLAVGERGADHSLEAILPEPGLPSRVLVLEQLTNPDNVGGLFRNAMAFGVDALLLCPRSADPLYRKSIRVSMGGALRVPFARAEDLGADLSRLRETGHRLVALHPGAEARALGSQGAAELGPRVALLLGTEGAGLSAALRAQADLALRVEMAPSVDSLNVATAAAIALHWLRSVECS